MVEMELKIGENIRKVRELRGYTQEYMAEKLGISQRAYSSIEKENKKIDTERLKKISEVLEVDVFDLLNFNDRILFSNTHFTQSGVGMFNTIHLNTTKQMEFYETQINDLKAEMKFLKEQMAFLQEIIQKKF